MHITKVYRALPKIKPKFLRHNSTVAALDQNEYTETPEYPPIEDLSLEARKLRKKLSTHEKIKNINTVEEKQIALNMPRYYGFKTIMLRDCKIPYNALPLLKCYTRTHFMEMDKLPDVYAASDKLAESIVAEIKPLVEDIITIEYEGLKHAKVKYDPEKSAKGQEEDALSKSIVKQFNRIITNNLAERAPHILSAQVDYDPRHEAFWVIGGIPPPRGVVDWRNKFKWLRHRSQEPVDRTVQYVGTPILTLRSNIPLKPIIPYSEAQNPEFKVEKFVFGPEQIGYFTEHRHGTNIPGFWPGDPDDFGLLSIHGRGHILGRKESFGAEDNLEALHCQAIKSSFGWLLAQANYLGFTTFNDITYPLATQTIITNGQLWSLYAYQLNTIEMHGKMMDENPKHNVCFGTKPLKLFESIENGKVQGLNEDVLKKIVQMYLNAPEERDHDMRPYLNQEEQVVADIEDDNKRIWLEKTYKHLMSNRERHNLAPEVYHWEHIYKIKHNTRFFEAKRRPFEKGINPFDRRLDQHLPVYIPKVLREYPKSKKKFEKTYYPDV